jgi:precorrin-2/cobalt-factor-2 C20-methyltransferase
MSGTLFLVGVGPGDPELLTLKAARVLGAADVVAYPTTGEGAALALSIAAPHLRAEAARLSVAIPMAIDPAPARAAYDTAAAAIRAHLDADRNVAWLCEGDPLFYGSAMYLLERLGGVAPVEVIPGVTSLTAAAAVARLPLAGRNAVLKVLPAPLGDETLEGELAGGVAAAIIKVGRHFERVRAVLDRVGRAGSAVVVEHATLPHQRITPLAAFAYAERPYFSTILSLPGREPRP